MGRGVGIEEVSSKGLSRSSFQQALRPQGAGIAAQASRKVVNASITDLMVKERRRQWEGDLEVLQSEDAQHDLQGQHLLEERQELLEQGKSLREARAVSRSNGTSGAGVVDRLAQEHYQAMAVFAEDLQQWRDKDAELRKRRAVMRSKDKQLSSEEKKRFERRMGKTLSFPQRLKAADKAMLLRWQSVFAAKRADAGSDFERVRGSLARKTYLREGEPASKVGKFIEGVFDEFLDLLWEDWPRDPFAPASSAAVASRAGGTTPSW